MEQLTVQLDFSGAFRVLKSSFPFSLRGNFCRTLTQLRLSDDRFKHSCCADFCCVALQEFICNIHGMWGFLKIRDQNMDCLLFPILRNPYASIQKYVCLCMIQIHVFGSTMRYQRDYKPRGYVMVCLAQNQLCVYQHSFPWGCLTLC